MLQYLEQMLLQTKHVKPSPRGLFSLTTFITTHTDAWNRGLLLDGELQGFFTRLEQSGILNNTVVLVFADHGLHSMRGVWPDLAREHEHRNPVFYALIGSRVQSRASMLHYLRKNRHRRLSSKDLHRALLHLASYTGSVDAASVNIFTEEAAVNRTCRDASVPRFYCNCWKHPEQQREV
jgi:hypothetical protein